MTILRDYALLSSDGRFHSAAIERLTELIEDYDPDLEVRWIPPDKRTDRDGPPFCIVHNPPPTSNRKPYVVFYFDESVPHYEILGRIYGGDSWHHNVLEKMEYRNKALEDLRKKEREEQRMESADMFHFLWTNRSKFTVNWRNPFTGDKYKLNSYRRQV